jgi:NAD(P)-dependent dehydrogenase (short-subunit alcohol dehydrogenase family)
MTDTQAAKNILITGAAGGLGSALAMACASRGAQLMLLDRNLRGLEELCDKVEQSGAPAPGFCQLDLVKADPDSMADLVAEMVGAYGGIDGLAHCAARFQGLQPMDQVGGDTWLSVLQVNLNAAWLVTMSCLPSLRKSGGTIVFPLDEPAAAGPAYWGPYGVSHSALRTMAQTLAEELEPSSCKVYGVYPGPMRTALRATAFHAEDPSSVPSPSVAAEQIAAAMLERDLGRPVFWKVS